jgi:hypothetical protein
LEIESYFLPRLAWTTILLFYTCCWDKRHSLPCTAFVHWHVVLLTIFSLCWPRAVIFWILSSHVVWDNRHESLAPCFKLEFWPCPSNETVLVKVTGGLYSNSVLSSQSSFYMTISNIWNGDHYLFCATLYFAYTTPLLCWLQPQGSLVGFFSFLGSSLAPRFLF